MKMITNKKPTISILFLAASLFFGCTSKMNIDYSLKNIKKSPVKDMSGYVLNIQPFEDGRDRNGQDGILFEKGRQYRDEEGEDYCINAEKEYEEGKVCALISECIARHLQKKGLFREVIVNEPEKADFTLEGTVLRFYGKREYSSAAMVAGSTGVQFGAIGGLLGGLMIMGMREPGEVVIQFTELKVLDRENRVLFGMDDLRHEVQRDMKVDGHCGTIFTAVNEELKSAVEILAEELETAIQEGRLCPGSGPPVETAPTASSGS